MNVPRDEDQHSADALFERLYDALGESGVDDIASMRKRLEDAGIDVSRVLEQGASMFDGFVRRERLRVARERFERAKRAVAEFRRGLVQSVGTAREELARALAGEASGEQYLAYFRKLENVDAGDIESLKDDAALLEFVSHLEADERGE